MKSGRLLHLCLTIQPAKATFLSIFFYNIFLLVYRSGLAAASFFNDKARKWVNGRKGIFRKLQNCISPSDKIVWMHCASLGEFEQGRPVLEKIKAQYPGYKILLTFFSPSGYEVQKNYPGADWVFYLPMDGPGNAKRFLEITHPSLVIFVKYEFWYYYLKKIKYRKIPLLLISAIFRKEMSFFQWYGTMQRKILSRFDHLFVQDKNSKNLVGEIGLNNICSISGDTRFDRVLEIAENPSTIPEIERFLQGNPVIVAGSTWPEDEQVLKSAFSSINNDTIGLIIAPHEVHEGHIIHLLALFPGSVLFSDLRKGTTTTGNCRILIIDNIGMLSKLYKYASIAYVGGGLKSTGVHNVLEAAVYNKPVIIGPYYEKYQEAIDLVNSGGGIVIKNASELSDRIMQLLKNENGIYDVAGHAAGEFVRANGGATGKILSFIQENRLLTN